MSEIDPRMRYVAVLDETNTRPRYVPLAAHSRGEAYPVQVHWPILTPDGGVMMATTVSDAERIADTLNALLDRIAVLEEQLAEHTRPVPPYSKSVVKRLATQMGLVK